ncbi:MAG: hypothetical protein DI549_11425, partial [Ancylobacter novellus]
VEDGGTLLAAPTSSAGVHGLSMNSLVLSEYANVDVVLGANTGNSVFSVGGLYLDGVLNVTNGGAMALGVYSLFDYTAMAGNNGLELGSTPTDFAYAIQVTSNQVNLEVLNGSLLYWNGTQTSPDGTAHGGAGTWTASTAQANWLTSPLNQSRTWNDGFAVFAGTSGTVTVDDSAGAVATAGMQFAVDGYVVEGDPITLAAPSGQTQIRVGNGRGESAGFTATIASELKGSTGMEKTDLGTLILTGNNSYTGGTTVTQGTLQIGNGGSTGAILGDVSVAGGATLAFNRNDAVTFAGNVTGGGRLVKSGASSMTLTGTNTYTGGTTIEAGSLTIGNGGTDGSILGNVVNNGSLAFSRLDDTTFAGAISGSGQLVKMGAGALTLSGTNSFTGLTDVQRGRLVLSGGSSLSDTAQLIIAASARVELADADEVVGSLGGSGALNLGSFCLTAGGDGSSRTFSGSISGSGCLKKTGEGTLALSGSSNFSGGTTVSAGAVQVSAAANLGTGGLALEGAGTLRVSGTFTDGRAISLTPVGGIGGGTVEIDASQTLTLSGTISGTGALTKTGTGQLILAGTNTYSGATTINAGILQASGGQALSDTGAVSVAAGAQLILTGNETVGSLAGAGQVTLTNAVLQLGGDDTDTVFSGALDGSGSLAKVGTGTLFLSGANSFTGGTTVAAGTVQVAAAAALGSGELALIGGGTLRASGSFSDGRTVTLAAVGGVGGTVEVDADTELTLTGVVAGSGSLTKSGAGSLTLSGTNTYDGATMVNAGRLVTSGGHALSDTGTVSVASAAQFVVQGGETIGSLAGEGRTTLASGILLLGAPGDSTTYAGTIDGAGALTKTGSGTFTLTGTNSYTGDTTVKDGTLTVDGSLASDVYVRNGATLSGGGSIARTVHVLDGGTLIGEQSSGLSMGGLDMAAGSTLGVTLGAPGTGVFEIAGDVTLAGTLNVNAAPDFGIGIYRIMSYGGSLTDNGISMGVVPNGLAGGVQTSIAGSVNLFIENADIPILFWNGASTSATQATLGGPGIWRADTTTNWINASGTIPRAWNSGFAVFQGKPGTVTVDGTAGAVTTTGMQFATSGYVVTGAPITLASANTTIRVGDGTQAGGAMQATISSELTGASQLEKTDYGTLILTADNSYTGGTLVTAGTLQLGNGGTTGSVLGDISVVAGATLVFNRSDTYNFPGTVSGDGAVQIVGGLVNFTGASGYTGSLSITQADFILQPGSTSVSSFVIGEGGTIGGSGTIGGLVVQNGGVAAPGYSPGTLTVNGNLTFNAGSTYTVDVTPSGQHDLIIATGTATLNGGTVQVVGTEGTYVPGSTYAILTAQGGVSGQFEAVTANYAFLAPTLTYGANDVFLTLMRNAALFGDAAITPNQKAAAGAIEALGYGNPIYDAVIQLTQSGAQASFDALSGEAYASTATLLQQDAIYLREAVGARVRQSFTDTPVAASGGPAAVELLPGSAATVWLQGYGAKGDFGGNGNAAGIDRSIGGFFAGADAALGEHWHVGIVGGYGSSRFDIDPRNSSGNVDSYDLGAYGGARFGALGLMAGLSYTWNDVSVDRTVAFPGYWGSASASYDAGTTQLFGEVSWKVDLQDTFDPKTYGKMSIEPFAGLAYVNLSSDGFTESGSTAALTGGASSQDTVYSTLGVRASSEITLANGATLVPHLSLGWQHAYGDLDPSVVLSFTGSTSPFAVSGAPIARDSALVGLGFEYGFSDRVSASVSYTGQFGEDVTDNSIKGGLNIRF